MSIEIKVPQMGESVVEATVGEWLKQEGDSISLGDVLVELETDKVDVEVGAESSGVLSKIAVQSGDDVRVGDLLGYIEPNGSGKPAKEAGTQVDASEEKTAVSAPNAEKITPVAQRMASEEGVDITKVKGSGPGGKVTKDDVAALLQSAKPIAKEAKPAETQTRKPSLPAAPPASAR